MHPSRLSIFSEVRYYRKFSQELQAHLARNPQDWTKFQDVFNLTVDRIYKDIQQFEKENINKFEDRVYQLKRIFVKRYRRYFLSGEYIKWSFDKPFGYAGDFKIIDSIYLNAPRTTGFDRLWDNYFEQLAVSCAVRERKEDFKNILLNFIKEHKGRQIRIMNLACGPAREIKELVELTGSISSSKITFDCYDFDTHALDYARSLIGNAKNINFFQKNAIRIALRSDVTKEIACTYDLIYSTGLFDYFDERVAIRLIANLKKVLKEGGLMVIANMRDKFSNPSAGWMEWVAEWFIIYRTEKEFRKIFLDAGFLPEDLKIVSQKSRVMQYCFAKIKE